MGHRGENETSFDDGERSNHFCGYQNLHQQQVTTNPASKIAERETKAVMLGANPGRTLLINFDMKYIDADKLIKAIEEKGLDCSFALKMERIDTLALIDELQQERQEELVSDDLEGVAKKYADLNCHNHVENETDWNGLLYAFKAGAEWMKTKMIKEDAE